MIKDKLPPQSSEIEEAIIGALMLDSGSLNIAMSRLSEDMFYKIDYKAIFKAITKKYPKLELVIAWNQPMLKVDTRYVFGVSVTKKYILMAPWSTKVIKQFMPKLADYTVNKKTIAIPNDWKVDEKLLQQMVKARLAE